MNIIIQGTRGQQNCCVSADSREELLSAIAEAIPQNAETVMLDVNSAQTVRVQSMLLMFAMMHNDLQKAVTDCLPDEIDISNISYVLNARTRLANMATMISHEGQKYGLPMDCPGAAGEIAVDWSKIQGNARLAEYIVDQSVKDGIDTVVTVVEKEPGQYEQVGEQDLASYLKEHGSGTAQS